MQVSICIVLQKSQTSGFACSSLCQTKCSHFCVIFQNWHHPEWLCRYSVCHAHSMIPISFLVLPGFPNLSQPLVSMVCAIYPVISQGYEFSMHCFSLIWLQYINLYNYFLMLTKQRYGKLYQGRFMCQVLTETVKDTIAILVPKSVFPYCEIFYLQCQLLFSRYSTVYVVESIYILTIVYFKTTFINLQGNFKRI